MPSVSTGFGALYQSDYNKKKWVVRLVVLQNMVKVLLFGLFSRKSLLIFLPLQSEEKEQFIDLSEPESCLEHKTILIAEDMDDNYLLYKIYLEKKYNLIRAENGEEAIF